MNWFSKKSSKEDESVEEALIKVGSPVLRVTVGDVHIASLFHDGETYCLTYTAKFSVSGLAPFNPNDLKKGELPEVNKVYRNAELWHVFAVRIPSDSRDDYKELMASLGLKGDEDPLFILGKVGRVSIAKPWKLELVSKVS